MAGNWGDFLPNAAQQGLGGIMGLALGAASNKQQFKQQTKLGHLQLGLNKLQTDYNMKKQLEMWEATNYSAQMEQLRKAGLNPGLLYGMSGGGGATTNLSGGANVGMAQAANHGATAASMAATTAQLGLMRAQKENIEADTANKQADTANKPLQGEQIKAQTSNLIQATDNAKVQKELMKVQLGIDQVREEVAKGTKDIQISQVYRTLEIANETLDGLIRENQVNEATKQDRIKTVKAELIGIGLQNILTKAQTANVQQGTKESKQRVVESQKKVEMMGEEMTKWVNEIMQGWTKLDLEGKRVKLDTLIQKIEIEKGYQMHTGTGGVITYTYDKKKLLRIIDEIMRED